LKGAERSCESVQDDWGGEPLKLMERKLIRVILKITARLFKTFFDLHADRRRGILAVLFGVGQSHWVIIKR
jgi:hypothetical protein